MNSSYINSVIKKTGYENFRITPSATDFKNDLKNFVYFQEEPILTYHISTNSN